MDNTKNHPIGNHLVVARSNRGSRSVLGCANFKLCKRMTPQWTFGK
jgi:hypothetical protein